MVPRYAITLRKPPLMIHYPRWQMHRRVSQVPRSASLWIAAPELLQRVARPQQPTSFGAGSVAFAYGLFVIAFAAGAALVIMALSLLGISPRRSLAVAYALGGAILFAGLGSLAGLVTGVLGLSRGGRGRKEAFWGVMLNGVFSLGLLAGLVMALR